MINAANAASKHAQLAFSRSLTGLLAPRGVRPPRLSGVGEHLHRRVPVERGPTATVARGDANRAAVSLLADFRTEHDSMGEVRVPADALWRAQTQRAVENFPISGTRLERSLIESLARIKAATAAVKRELDMAAPDLADAIAAAAAEVAAGSHDREFPIDVFQTGSGTSSNMNMNEVLATLAGRAGTEVHPNDHVNASQSSNDTFPTSIHVAATGAIEQPIPS